MSANDSAQAQLTALVGRFVAVAGAHTASQVESDLDPTRIDHVWIDVKAGDFGRLRLSLNTFSRMSSRAGQDGRMSVAIASSRWSGLPAPGVAPAPRFDYATIVSETAVTFRTEERTDLEQMLLDRARRSALIEAWGELYHRGHFGLHQLHSRAASAAVRTKHSGRDGAVRFYFADKTAETVLLKFDGQ